MDSDEGNQRGGQMTTATGVNTLRREHVTLLVMQFRATVLVTLPLDVFTLQNVPGFLANYCDTFT